jgi:hypothetical protein
LKYNSSKASNANDAATLDKNSKDGIVHDKENPFF